MEGKVLTKETIERFYQHLLNEEKSANTVEKYIRDARAFMCFADGAEIKKELVIGCKQTDGVHVTGIAISSDNELLKPGETVQLTATVTTADATNKSVLWASSNSTIATVDENGLVTAKADGTIVVTASTVDGSFTASCIVRVKSDNVAPNISVGNIDGYVGTVIEVPVMITNNPGINFAQLRISYDPKVHKPVEVVNGSVFTTLTGSTTGSPIELYFKSDKNTTANGTIATIKFEVLAAAEASAIQIQSIGDISNAQNETVTAVLKSGSVTTTVMPRVLESITVKSMPKKTTYKVGETLETNGLTLLLKYDDGTTEVISNGFVCTPTKLSKEGEQTITVSYAGQQANFKVTVEKQDDTTISVESITLSQENLSLKYKDKYLLTYTLNPTNATNQNVKWKSSNTSVVTVDDKGNVVAVGTGTATITIMAEDGSITDTVTVNVKYTWWQWIIRIVLLGWLWY